MPLKRIVLIIMCVMLLLTVIVMAVVIGKVAPVFSALLNPPEVTEPSTTQTEPTVPTTTTEPTVPPTTEPTVPPTTEPSVPPTTKPEHKHDFSALKEEKKPTCKEAGYKIYSCECGEEKLETMDVLEHSFGIGKLVSPTCTEEGCTLYTCSACGFEDKRNVQEKLGHDMKFVEEVKVSCEQQGYKEYKCARTGCGEIDHDEIVEKTGHNWVKGEVVNPSCTKEGYTPQKCSVCEKEEELEVKDALGHSFGQWQIKTEPATGKTGEEERKCSVCEEKETRDIELGILLGNGIQSSQDGNTMHWIVNVGAKDSKGKEVVVFSYEIIDNSGLIKRDSFAYDPETGLIVTFQDKNGENQTYPLISDDKAFTFDKDGKMTAGSDESTGGTTTPSEPSGGTTTPSEPSGGTTTPSEPSGGTTTPSEPAGGTTTPSEPAGGTTTPSEPAGGTTTPSEPTGENAAA